MGALLSKEVGYQYQGASPVYVRCILVSSLHILWIHRTALRILDSLIKLLPFLTIPVASLQEGYPNLPWNFAVGNNQLEFRDLEKPAEKLFQLCLLLLKCLQCFAQTATWKSCFRQTPVAILLCRAWFKYSQCSIYVISLIPGTSQTSGLQPTGKKALFPAL